MSSQFVHLRVHSDFSMQDGLNKTLSILDAVSNLHMPSIAITDQMNMCGLVRFYSGSISRGIKPIVGCDINLYNAEIDNHIGVMTLLAMNETGYKNITNIISAAYLRGHQQHKPVVDFEQLKRFNQNIILLSGGMDSDLGFLLTQGKISQAKALASRYCDIFRERFYIEVSRTDRTSENEYLTHAVNLAATMDIPIVATNNVMFLKESDFEAHEIRTCISEGYTLEDNRRPKNYTAKQYLRSSEEMLALFADMPQAIENTVEIAKRCNVQIKLNEYFLPQFPTGEMSTEDYLIKQSQQGLEVRLAALFPDEETRFNRRLVYDERLKIELDVINQMGFPGYFLIVMEFIQWSKQNNIPVGPGRGSGAGSLVAYALDITDLDPLEFDLLFERFLNPERVSMPDFDIDFCMDRRDEVIEHVADMYGREAVSQIITFGTMAAKAVIRDVGRVQGQPYGFVDRIAKLVPGDPGMTLKKAFETEPRLQEAYDKDEEVRELINMARILEGVTRNAGKHAGGVVISPTTITDFSPLYCDENGENPVTQFDKNDVETAGLVKFDFLGLRTLTIIQWAIETIKQVKGIDIDITQIPLDDQACFDLLQKAQSTAVFQLESRGMKDLIKRLQPDCFEDIIALVALFRPGPLQSGMVDNFIDRKHGREEISYPDATYQHDSLKEILQPTYGIILYQEQVMQIAQEMSGYTLGGADLLRRAMGKKKPEEMAKQRSIFEQGAKDNNIDPELAMKIFDLVEKFAGYGFNKSHSAAYALVSYQTLYLKTHYPAEFMAAVLSADMDNTDKVVIFLDECKRMQLEILPPDLNNGQYKFSVNHLGQIVYGIGAVKGVGLGPVEAIIEAREQKGLFTDLFDFCAKIDLKKINKRVVEKLILSGAFDSFGGSHRASLMSTLKEAFDRASQTADAALAGQGDLFGVQIEDKQEIQRAFKAIEKWSEPQWLAGEKETLGLYLTGHPINYYADEIKSYTESKLRNIKPTRKGNSISVAGLVLSVRTIVNKKGQRWALLTIDDNSARLDVRVYADLYEKYEELIKPDALLWCRGSVSFDDYSDDNVMTAEEVSTLLEARTRFVSVLELRLPTNECSLPAVEKLKSILQKFSGGSCPLQLNIAHNEVVFSATTSQKWFVHPTDELLYELKHELGASAVTLKFS